ncbi:hypothetical protein LTR66_012466 [Elasticomyces elasticus]|nr:hypothetical protein LTR66_012466 [Elasticomyces elasticus]
MFGLPQAKRVRRDELFSPTSSPGSTPDPYLTDLILSQAQQQQHYKPTPPAPPHSPTTTPPPIELEFHLFAPSRTAAAAAASAPQKIRLSTPDTATHAPAFITPHRDATYYFTGPPSSAQKARYELTALSGTAVLARSRSIWPGFAHPWKVTHITSLTTITSSSSTSIHPTLPPENKAKRTRPGKKYRLRLRMRSAAERAQREGVARRVAEKEAAEREKRTRRNREKKVKRKARGKAVKGAAGGDGGAAVEDVKV